MPIHYECAQCGAAMSIRDDRAGTKAKCPQCKEAFVVPQPGDDAETSRAVEESTAESSPPDDQDEGDAAERDPVAATDRQDDSPDDVLRLDTSDDDSDELSAAVSVPRRGFELDESSTGSGGLDEPEPRPRRGPFPDRKATGSASSVAGDLLKTRKVEEAGKRRAAASSPYAFAEQQEKREEIKPDLVETAKYLGRSFLFPLLGVLAACLILYWISSSMMKTRKLPDVAKVTGTVTLDGAPLAGAMLEFHPVEGLTPGVAKASSFAITDEKGRYRLAYLQDVEGAVVGEHHVQIRARDEVGRERLPNRYNSRTTLKFEVKPGSNACDWELTSDTGPGPAAKGK